MHGSISVSVTTTPTKPVEVKAHDGGFVTISWGPPIVIAMTRQQAVELAANILDVLPEASE